MKEKELIEKRAVEYLHGLHLDPRESFWSSDGIVDAYTAGYLAAKKRIDDEVQRAFLEDYTDVDEEYMEAAQGSLARLHMWIEHLMDKED